MAEMNSHWRASVALNRALCGSAGEPLCARVYRQPLSRWRSVYLFAADVAFSEFEHCKRVHRDWQRSRSE